MRATTEDSDPVEVPRPLAALLHSRLRGSSAPVIIAEERTVPAASLWTAARALVRDLRALGVQPGDRILVSTTDDVLLAASLVAGLTSGITVAFLRSPGDDIEAAALAEHVDAVDARLVLTSPGQQADATPRTGTATASLAGLVGVESAILRPRRHPPQPEIAVLVHTSGSTGRPNWVALSQPNLRAVLDSHLPALFGDGWDANDPTSRPAGVMASTLPWAHAFGLVLDLLVGLVAADVILRDPTAGKDPSRLVALLDRAGPGAWLNAVPLTLSRIQRSHPHARDLFARLAGGIVGGAPCSVEVCAMLAGTAMRLGYGLSEAGPGVCLADPGDFAPGLLGRPVGCQVDVTDRCLVVSGPNVSLGVLDSTGALRPRNSDRLATHDTVRRQDSRYVFTGRMADTVKLLSGRWLALSDVDAEVLAGTGLSCLAVAGSDTAISLVVDGVAADAEAVRTWLAGVRRNWVSQVRDVVPIASEEWPRTAKGAVRRHGPGGLHEAAMCRAGSTR